MNFEVWGNVIKHQQSWCPRLSPFINGRRPQYDLEAAIAGRPQPWPTSSIPWELKSPDKMHGFSDIKPADAKQLLLDYSKLQCHVCSYAPVCDGCGSKIDSLATLKTDLFTWIKHARICAVLAMMS